MKRCKFLTLMLTLLLLLQSSVLAANTDTTVTVTLPTFAVTLNDTKIDSADKSEYAGVPYSNLSGAAFVYRKSGEAAVTLKAEDLFSDGEYYFDCQDGTNAPMLSDGVLTLSARQMDSTGQTTVRLKIDLRSGTLLP